MKKGKRVMEIEGRSQRKPVTYRVRNKKAGMASKERWQDGRVGRSKFMMFHQAEKETSGT